MTPVRRIAFSASTVLSLIFATCNPKEDVVQPSLLNSWKYFDTTDGLPSNFISTLYEDKSGQIWVGTDDGLSVYNGDGFHNYTTSDGLADNGIIAVVEGGDGDIWVGSNLGLNVLRDGQWLVLSFFQDKAVSALVELVNKDILIATYGDGVYRYKYTTNTLSQYDVSNTCGPCNQVTSMRQDSKGAVWIGSEGGAKRITDNASRTFTTADGLSDISVPCLAEDAFGNMWVGGFEATTVSRIHDNVVEQITYSNGASQNFTVAMTRDAYGNMWFGLALFGLYKYDGSFMARDFDGPPHPTITALLSDSHSNLWVGTSQGGLARCVFAVK